MKSVRLSQSDKDIFIRNVKESVYRGLEAKHSKTEIFDELYEWYQNKMLDTYKEYVDELIRPHEDKFYFNLLPTFSPDFSVKLDIPSVYFISTSYYTPMQSKDFKYSMTFLSEATEGLTRYGYVYPIMNLSTKVEAEDSWESRNVVERFLKRQLYVSQFTKNKIEAHNAKVKVAHETTKSMLRQIEEVMYDITTSKQLREAFPDLINFIPDNVTRKENQDTPAQRKKTSVVNADFDRKELMKNIAYGNIVNG